MNLKKVNINLTEEDIGIMVENICKEIQNTQKSNNITDLFTELLLKNVEACNLFVQVMLGNGLPEALRKGDIVKCSWDRLKMGLSDSDKIHEELVKNDLISDDMVICRIETFRGYTEYFPYTIQFKYGEDLYASCSMGFDDVHP
tara:strand:- start:11034 stop:11465 length:432 start_codon:yes stop_codon:yes gene_type:complete